MQFRVLLIGAGGHARVCLEALADDPDHLVIGAVSRDGTGVADLLIPMIGTDDDVGALMGAHSLRHAHVAIGDNVARAGAAARWVGAGGELRACVSRFAMPSRSAAIGPGAALLPGAVVNAATTIGTGAIVNTNASIDHDCEIGDFAHIAPGAAIAGNVGVGPRTLVGIGSRVLPGLRIGADVVVGAGAVVTADVPDGAVVVGIPARVRRP